MSDTSRVWTRIDDRCYHGTGTSLILVELFNPKRSDPEMLSRLVPNGPAGEFSWGYIGTGTNTSAKAILADALGYEPTQRLWQDFADDVLSQCPAEFRLRRGAVLRWARGWAEGYGVTELPEVLRDLPPVSHTAYSR
jgi:hypothetical protein